VVLVEEQAATGLRLADSVVMMELGRVAWSGPAAGVDAARLAATYLGEADLVAGEPAGADLSEEPTR
jgi:ABC-type branched-subunit amino acid transport system ATPase component